MIEHHTLARAQALSAELQELRELRIRGPELPRPPTMWARVRRAIRARDARAFALQSSTHCARCA